MPTYDYKCLECGNIFELFQRINDDPISNCPNCNGHVKRLIGAGAGPIFKGKGFYQTDYKNNVKKSEDKPVEKKADTSSAEKTK
jgi:putative FmdB family regulatory protein